MNKTTQLLWGWCHKPWNKDPYETPMDILDIIILLGKEIILNPRNGGRWKMILYLPFQYYWFFSIRMLIFRVVKPFPKKNRRNKKNRLKILKGPPPFWMMRFLRFVALLKPVFGIQLPSPWRSVGIHGIRWWSDLSQSEPKKVTKEIEL